MAWRSLREGGRSPFDGAPARVLGAAHRAHGDRDQPAEPELSLFFLAFLPQFVQADEPDRIGRRLQAHTSSIIRARRILRPWARLG